MTAALWVIAICMIPFGFVQLDKAVAILISLWRAIRRGWF